MSQCKIEAIVSIDRRGQIILPEGLRDKSNIHTGEKLVVICSKEYGRDCHIFLVKEEYFGELFTNVFDIYLKKLLKAKASKEIRNGTFQKE